MTSGSNFLAVFMLDLLRTEHYRCSMEVLGSSRKAYYVS